ncbi:MAG: hypothetical protein QOJ38_1888 [Solirubrobacterales bacterium]|nr:hypothetical protein [Solirubrobacterales bacterium]
MADRDEIIAFCDELLSAADFEDYGPNGLQVPGASAVERIASGVSANQELLSQAVEDGAQLCLVHHGLFWEGAQRSLTPQLARRLRTLLAADVSLAAYHLPLDAHTEIGNNALLCERLGLERTGEFAEHRGTAIGVIGHSAAPLSADELVSRLSTAVGRQPLIFAEGPAAIATVGIVSGGAASSLAEAIALGLDAFITGEPSEQALADAREGGIHFIAGGHHATERAGIARLGELVAERFGLEHQFIDVPNPI